jgi:hypothetical protein
MLSGQFASRHRCGCLSSSSHWVCLNRLEVCCREPKGGSHAGGGHAQMIPHAFSHNGEVRLCPIQGKLHHGGKHPYDPGPFERVRGEADSDVNLRPRGHRCQKTRPAPRKPHLAMDEVSKSQPKSGNADCRMAKTSPGYCKARRGPWASSVAASSAPVGPKLNTSGDAMELKENPGVRADDDLVASTQRVTAPLCVSRQVWACMNKLIVSTLGGSLRCSKTMMYAVCISYN